MGVYKSAGSHAARELDPGTGKTTTRAVLSATADGIKQCNDIKHGSAGPPALKRLTAVLNGSTG